MNVQTTIFDFLGAEEETPKTVTTVTAIKTVEPSKKEEPKKLEDFGKKIGSARKDYWHDNHLSISDIKEMSEKEKKEFITKNNVFPAPKWKELKEKGGYDELVLFGKKRVRDSLPSTPAYYAFDADTASANFVELVAGIRDALQQVEEIEDFSKLNHWLWDNGFVEGRKVTEKGAYLNISKVNTAIQEVQPVNNGWLRLKLNRSNFCSSTTSSSTKPRKQKFKMEELKDLVETGFDYIDRDVTPDDILALGFRGGEFGNWTNQAERQLHLNMTYNAINNVATALDITPQQFLFPKACKEKCEALGIGFGSRGHSSALAHYEPLLHVINLTRMKGAGSLGHELGHAFDHMLHEGAMNETKDFYAFEKYNYTYFFKDKKVQEALKKLYKAIHEKPLTVEEAIEIHKTNKEKALNEIRDYFNNYVKDKVCENADDEQLFDDTLSEYLYEISMGDEFTWNCDDTITGKYSQKPMFELMRETRYRKWLKRKRCVISNENNALKKIAETGVTNEVVKAKFFEDAGVIDANYSKCGHGYWQSDVELFARAWACYLKDKLSSKGIVDDYLNGHADSKPIRYGDVVVYTSPQGEERKRINQAFDYLIDVLKDEDFF